MSFGDAKHYTRQTLKKKKKKVMNKLINNMQYYLVN